MKINSLFLKSFDKKRFKHKKLINELLSEIEKSEKNLIENLENIRIDFPNLTDHSLKHSKALWNYAQLIIGDDEYLNPLEAYVLHMCFLIHDAGMCFSILNNKDEIENTDFFKDFIALNSTLENPEYEALFYCVRKLHGEFALRIPQVLLSSGKMVIENEELRDELAEIIGKISKSHSCDVSYIENELNIYTKPNFIDIPIDCKKIAYILRVSDAAHLDNLRTPLTRKQINEKIKGESKEHWIFQKKLGFPSSENGLLVYHSSSNFGIDEKKSWWLCYEALKMLDNELRKADVYFTETNKLGFAIKGIKGIENTLILGENFIKTDGWKSIDSKVKVSNPKLMALNVGGKNLYGSIFYAVRELLQNSIDAINVRRLRDSNYKGKIIVKLEKIDDEYFLIIEDNGIGMSRNVLVNQLLDFGNSYWNSYDFYDEYVGIARTQYKSIGKFGIGFFSVFMLGDYVEVDSVKYGDLLSVRNRLIFEHGLYENPILSEYNSNNFNNDYGTFVKVKLHENPYNNTGFIGVLKFKNNRLYDFIRYLIPSTDYDIIIQELGEEFIYKNKIDDEKEYTYGEILSDIIVDEESGKYKIINLLKSFPLKLLKLKIDGNIVGQLGLIPKISAYTSHAIGLIISNGIRVSTFSNELLGYVKVDEISNLNRTKFSSKIPYSSFYDWGIRQIEYLEKFRNDYKFDEVINGLKFSLDLLNSNHDIFGLILNGSIYRFNETSFKIFIKDKEEVLFYTLMQTVNKDYVYNGFIFLIRPVNFGDLMDPNDKPKVNTYENYVEKLILQVWGDCEINRKSGLDDYVLNTNPMDAPYLDKKTYKRKYL